MTYFYARDEASYDGNDWNILRRKPFSADESIAKIRCDGLLARRVVVALCAVEGTPTEKIEKLDMTRFIAIIRDILGIIENEQADDTAFLTRRRLVQIERDLRYIVSEYEAGMAQP